MERKLHMESITVLHNGINVEGVHAGGGAGKGLVYPVTDPANPSTINPYIQNNIQKNLSNNLFLSPELEKEVNHLLSLFPSINPYADSKDPFPNNINPIDFKNLNNLNKNEFEVLLQKMTTCVASEASNAALAATLNILLRNFYCSNQNNIKPGRLKKEIITCKAARKNYHTTWTNHNNRTKDFYQFIHNARRFDYRSNKLVYLVLKTTNEDDPVDLFKLHKKNKTKLTYHFNKFLENIQKHFNLYYWQTCLEFDPDTGHPHINFFFQLSDDEPEYKKHELLEIVKRYWKLADVSKHALSIIKTPEYYRNCVLFYCVDIPGYTHSADKLKQMDLPDIYKDLHVKIRRINYARNRHARPIVRDLDYVFCDSDLIKKLNVLEPKSKKILADQKQYKADRNKIAGDEVSVTDPDIDKSTGDEKRCEINDIIDSYMDENLEDKKPIKKNTDNIIDIVKHRKKKRKPYMSYNERINHDSTELCIIGYGWFSLSLPFKRFISQIPGGGFNRDKFFYFKIDKDDLYLLLLMEAVFRIIKAREAAGEQIPDVFGNNPMHEYASTKMAA